MHPTGEGLSAECHRVGASDYVKSEQLHHKNMGGHFSAVATAVGDAAAEVAIAVDVAAVVPAGTADVEAMRLS